MEQPFEEFSGSGSPASAEKSPAKYCETMGLSATLPSRHKPLSSLSLLIIFLLLRALAKLWKITCCLFLSPCNFVEFNDTYGRNLVSECWNEPVLFFAYACVLEDAACFARTTRAKNEGSPRDHVRVGSGDSGHSVKQQTANPLPLFPQIRLAPH